MASLPRTKEYSVFASHPQHNIFNIEMFLFIYLFGVLRRFQHCTGHITTGSWKGRGNQYIEFARVVYCKLPTNGNVFTTSFILISSVGTFTKSFQF